MHFRKVCQAAAVRMDLKNAGLEVSHLGQTLVAGEAASQVRIWRLPALVGDGLWRQWEEASKIIPQFPAWTVECC